MTTTEVPTFFGPADSPLFGVVHLPADNQIRGGVLICGSLGKEGLDSSRLNRTLADRLAGRGFCVLRFDYLGTGDSAFAQGRDDAVADWTASVSHAVDYLTTIGAEPTTAVGIRAGCLILQEYLARPHRIERVAYLDPAGTGRRYLREHTALFRLAVGDDGGAHGEVTVIGGRFSEPAAAQFSALRMSADSVGMTFMVGRPGETDKHLTALASAAGVTAVTAKGLPECARPQEIYLPVPAEAVDSIVDWTDANGPAGRRRAAPRYATTVTIPGEGPDGVDVVETIERIESHGLFAIRTRPAGPVTGKTVLFFVTAKDLHVGPAREWVELSRRLAATGAQALRWDPAGLGLSGRGLSGRGLSGPIDRDPWRNVYFKADVADAIAAARHACADGGALEVVGICSGSWYAARAARAVGARSAVMVNGMVWNWRIVSTVPSQWYQRKRALEASAGTVTTAPADETAAPGDSRTTRLKKLLNPGREPAKVFLHKHFPRLVLRLLSVIGFVWRPEVILAALARGGTDVTVIASPDDEQQFTAKGGRAALARLQGSAHPPCLIATPRGDHSGHHQAILAAIREVVLSSVRDEVRGEALFVGAHAARRRRP